MRSERDDAGQIAGMEGLIFGVLIFVLGTLVIANAWGVIDAKLAASSAAREATRTFVESRRPTAALAADDAAVAADEVITGYGRSTSRSSVRMVEGSLERCDRVTFEVTYDVPMVAIPVLARLGTGFHVSARHSEIVDPYRSGLQSTSTCPAGLQP